MTKQPTVKPHLPDGTPFPFWDDATEYTRTYHVACDHSEADDSNDGSEGKPFETIGRAAELLQPGERVVIHEGIYREIVRPACGGESAERMIQYAAAQGQAVVITGAQEYEGPWERSMKWRAAWSERKRDSKPNTDDAPVWHVQLPGEWFDGYLPFGMINMPQHHLDDGRAFGTFPREHMPKLLMKRGLVFQDGRRLKQVIRYPDLASSDGAYWCEATGRDVHVRPYGDVDPASCAWELTAREQAFAPRDYGLDYIRVSGITIRHCADQFSWPQGGALSAREGRNWIIEDCTIEQVNANGIDIGASQHPARARDRTPGGGHAIRRNVFRDCGLTGLCGSGVNRHVLVEDNLFEDNAWHDVERMWENAHLKMHWADGCLCRRNLFCRTTGGSGIWLDFGIKNCRISGNVILDTKSVFGGVFIEAAKIGSVIVDHNVIARSRGCAPLSAAAGDAEVKGGHGVYEHDSDRMIVVHNLLVDCEGDAVHMRLGQPDRLAVTGRGATCRNHRIMNNLVVGCAGGIYFGRPHNSADGNAYAKLKGKAPWTINEPLERLDFEGWREFHGHDAQGGIVEATCVLDDEKSEVRVSMPSALPSVATLEFPRHDVQLKLRGETTVSGPIDAADATEFTCPLDPRQLD